MAASAMIPDAEIIDHNAEFLKAFFSKENKLITVEENGSKTPPDEGSGVQAVETGARVLEALASLGPAPMLKTIAESAGMSPGKVHRYLVSLIRSGLATRDTETGRYTLGPLAVHLGMVALRRLDVMKAATPFLAPLRDEISQSVFIAMWNKYGPVIVRAEEVDDPLVITARSGTALPVLPSSTGRVFAAYLPKNATQSLIQQNLRQNPNWIRPFTTTDELLSDVRERGIARTQGELNPGVSAFSAPIFNHEGVIIAAISALGVTGAFDTDWDSPIAMALKRSASAISRKMGYWEDVD